jgi:hypothetical protein
LDIWVLHRPTPIAASSRSRRCQGLWPVGGGHFVVGSSCLMHQAVTDPLSAMSAGLFGGRISLLPSTNPGTPANEALPGAPECRNAFYSPFVEHAGPRRILRVPAGPQASPRRQARQKGGVSKGGDGPVRRAGSSDPTANRNNSVAVGRMLIQHRAVGEVCRPESLS